ncbi:MAG: membrane dipeptidase [Sphingomonadales bacterium]
MKFTRRTLLKIFSSLAALGAGGTGFNLAFAEENKALRKFFEKSQVIDALTLGLEWDEVEFEALSKSGLSGFHCTLLNRIEFDDAIADLRDWDRRFTKFPDIFRAALKAEDFLKAKKNGQVAVLLGYQDTLMIGQDVDRLDTLHELGTRCLQLTYNYRNFVGNGCLERVDGGLSDFGLEVVQRMNDLGILIDLSHSGVNTTLDGIAVSKKPVAFTHTMCEAIYKNHPRAKTDTQIRALADKGGYIGITMIGYFVGPDPGGETTIENYVNHIDHAVNIAGIDHVGLSSDFAIRGIQPWATRENWYEPRLEFFKPSYQVRWPPWIPELDVPERFWNTTVALQKRGYSEDQIEKLLGQNWLRLFAEVL